MLFLIIFIISSGVLADKIYKKVDESGAVEFSDKESHGAEKIQVKPNVVDVRMPDMPKSTPTKKPKKAPVENEKAPEVIETGSGTYPAGNLRRKINNVTNGEGVKRPVNPVVGRPVSGAGGGGRSGGK